MPARAGETPALPGTARRAKQRGSVLIIVLWICIGLAAIAFTFANATSMAYRGADNDLAGRQSEKAIEGGAEYALTIMSSLLPSTTSTTGTTSTGTTPTVPLRTIRPSSSLGGIASTTPGVLPEVTDYVSESVPVGSANFWFLGGAQDTTTTGATQGTSTQPLFGLVDEASKIPINLVKDPNSTSTTSPLFEMLILLPNMTEELAAAIVDWRDEDDEISASGAESETYQLRQPAYTAKNAPFESVDEVALCNGATYELLYGEDANQNGVLDPNENDGDESLPHDNSDGKLDPGILSYLTCFTRESNKRADNTTARVNISGSSFELSTLLTEKLGADRSLAITTSLASAYTSGVPLKSVMEFYIRSEMTADELGLIIGDVSVTDENFIDGRVNVNTATETVLACLPGVVDKASTVVASRNQRQTKDENIAWFREALGDDAAAIAAGPYITGRTSQVSADIAAVGRNNRGYRRERFVIDNATGVPQIIYRRDLSGLGWALGSDVRTTLAQQKEGR